jgi:hypothetical protein
MRYIISYDLNKPGQNYQPLYNALAAINAKRILQSQWVANRINTSTKDLATHFWTFMDANDRLLVTELEGAGWYSFNLMVDPNTV